MGARSQSENTPSGGSMNGQALQRCVLLTGGTGFLGAQVARKLFQETNLVVIALVRAENQAAAIHRLARAWWDWPELVSSLNDGLSVEVIPSDISLPHLGLEEAIYTRLIGCITHIIHTAADLRVDAPLEEMRKTNVAGTAHLLELAHFVQHDHGLERFAHISTAYVAGARSGVIPEADLTDEYGFNSAYEQSKYEGECLVQLARGELPISVFRPGMIVGASDTGEIRTFNTFYFPLRLYLTGKLRILPVNRALPINLVPVDYVAESITRLTFCPEAKGQTFHLTAPTDSLPKAGELVEFVRGWAREHLGLRLPRPIFIGLPLPQKQYQPERDYESPSEGQGSTRRKFLWSTFNHLLNLLPYFNESKLFQQDNVDQLLGPYQLNWREFLPRLLTFATNQSFMHRMERTVHEQLLTRLGSKTRPVNYFDYVQGKLVQHSAIEIRRDILAAAGALTAFGILPGERVAIVGLNSTRYLILDAAIGLIGAVSVPLYFTSPPVDIDHILTASGAKLLLVGAPKIMERLGEIKTRIPVVSFSHGSVPTTLGREVVAWEAFMAMGTGGPTPLTAPVAFGDLATLRYTSGTTGRPKGVSFQHQQLRWMAQTMASLLPWKARNRTANYISFLPMSHVTEGILATYSPYYLPAPVNVYFVEDLKDIQQALPRVRPSVFFSVPRIYERIWEAIGANPAGRRYLEMPEGLRKRALRVLLRWQTLRKAGLDHCTLLLAGSAPFSDGLLQNFRGLGIEIHNAYGLTEAPLVTLNRPGVNRLGTVGEPLPQTEIRLAEDGEVLVRGPQVMAGYFREPGGEGINQPFRDGWLLTGDLGSISAEGSLVLKGRKKELIKTSYGKYVEPAKVESLLREIPGVSEAMLVGEKHPFCVALLWTHDRVLNPDLEQRIDHQVVQVNHNLSHPEQVKRWAVLANDLSIEKGDLTPNLKLKRQAIARRLEGVLEGLYKGMSPSQAVLHIGMAGKN